MTFKNAFTNAPINDMDELEDRADLVSAEVRNHITEGDPIIVLSPKGMFVSFGSKEDIPVVTSFFIEGLYKWNSELNGSEFTDLMPKGAKLN